MVKGPSDIGSLRCSSLDPSDLTENTGLLQFQTSPYHQSANSTPGGTGPVGHSSGRRFSFQPYQKVKSPRPTRLFGGPGSKGSHVRLSLGLPHLISSSVDEEEAECPDVPSGPSKKVSIDPEKSSDTSQSHYNVEFIQQPEVLYHHVFDPAGSGSHDRSRRKSLAREAFQALYYLNSPPRMANSADFGVFSSKLQSNPHLPSFPGKGIRKSSSKDTVHLTYFNNTYSSHSHHPQTNFSPPSSVGARNSYISSDLDESDNKKVTSPPKPDGVCFSF